MKTNKENKEMTNKKEVEETTAQDINYEDIDYSVVNVGPLYIDSRYKQPGFAYQWVGNLPGQLEYYQRLGYETVFRDEIPQAGQETVSRSSAFGNAVTVASKCGQTLVLMKISDKLHAKLQAHRDAKVEKIKESLGHLSGVPQENQIGSITYKK